MARIRVIFENGDPERVIEFNPADAIPVRATSLGSKSESESKPKSEERL